MWRHALLRRCAPRLLLTAALLLTAHCPLPAGKLDKSERQLEQRDRHLAEAQQQLKLYKQWVAG